MSYAWTTDIARQKRSLELSYSPATPLAPQPAAPSPAAPTAQAAKKKSGTAPPKKYLVVQTPDGVYKVPMSHPSIPQVIALLNYVTSVLYDDGAEQRALGDALYCLVGQGKHIVTVPKADAYVRFLEPLFECTASSGGWESHSLPRVTPTHMCAMLVRHDDVAQMHRLCYEQADVGDDNEDDDDTIEQ